MHRIAVCASLFFAVAWSERVDGQSPAIVVGPNVNVSGALPQRAHGEVSVSADSERGDRLLACAMVTPNRVNQAVHIADGIVAYLSLDGGRSWKLTLDTLPPPSETLVVPTRGSNHFGDPSCEFGPNGVAYTAFLTGAPPNWRALVLTSPDGGNSWRTGQSLTRIGDRAWLSVDRTSSKFKGRVYLVGQLGLRIAQSAADTFGLPVRDSLEWGMILPPDSLQVAYTDHGDAAILADGTYLELVWQQRFRRNSGDNNPTFTYLVMASEDGGKTFLPRQTIGSSRPCLGKNWGDSPRIAVDASNSAFRDRVYAAWSDYTGGRCRIMFTYSRNRGKAWTRAVELDDVNGANGGSAPDNIMPTIAVNHDGVVGVMWYDRRDITDNRSYRPRFAYSLDGGESFHPSVPLIDKNRDRAPRRVMLTNSQYNFDPRRQALGHQSWRFIGGNYAGMAADTKGRFHPVWVDDLTGVPQLWTSVVTVNRRAALNGDPALSSWRDVSDSVRVDIVNVWHDQESGIITADVYVTNATSRPLAGSLKLQALSLRSDIGTPAILNSDNGASNAGAVWNLDEMLDGGSLQPGKQTTRAKRLRFRLSDVKSLKPPVEAEPAQYPRLIEFRTKVLNK